MKASWKIRLLKKCEWKDSGCFEWIGYKDKGGYGQMYRKPKLEYTHRLAWEIVHGPIPEGMEVCHTCDNPSCCNWVHLFLGTQADNVADMNFKGRHAIGDAVNAAHGEKAARAKLKLENVIDMRLRMAMGETPASVAAEYGISRRQASNIRSGRQWNHEILMGSK